MTNITKNNLNAEQIKNEAVKAVEFYKKLKIYFEKDEFGIANIAAKKDLDKRNTESTEQLQRLVALKEKTEKVLKTLTERKETQLAHNKKQQESLLQKLNLQVTK